MYGCFCYRVNGIIVTRHVGSAAQLQLESYSTTERMTRHRWADGKPIYTRTISFNNPTVDGVVPHGASIGEPVRIEVKRGNEAIGVGFMHTASSGIFFRFDSTNVTIRNMGSLSSQPCLVTLYYTKP